MRLTAIFRCVGAAVDSAPVRFFPPGGKADRGAIEKFLRLVRRELRNGRAVQLDAVGAVAAGHSLLALASPEGARPQFWISWVPRPGATAAGGPSSATGEVSWETQALRFSASTQEDASNGDSTVAVGAPRGAIVRRGTAVPVLSQRLAKSVRLRGGACVESYLDAKAAISTLALATAAAAELLDGRPLRCEALQEQSEDQPRARLVLRLWPRAVGGDGDDFWAWPPGSGADPEVASKFRRSVQERLGRGSRVALELRGREAARQALEALARAPVKVAEVEASWAFASTEGVESRALRLRAAPGDTWQDFNTIDFMRTKRLLVKPATVPTALGKAIGAELNERRAVAVHCDMGDAAAVYVAVKALASVPGRYGIARRVYWMPSIGVVRREEDVVPPEEGASQQQGPLTLLRIFVRPRPPGYNTPP